ncbi:hypothetical protein I656_02353 [Geobacillus sp. WSUCF1]|nr:hypothetical protein I656_02353 [Geobacillus sp. WSUCF1]
MKRQGDAGNKAPVTAGWNRDEHSDEDAALLYRVFAFAQRSGVSFVSDERRDDERL